MTTGYGTVGRTMWCRHKKVGKGQVMREREMVIADEKWRLQWMDSCNRMYKHVNLPMLRLSYTTRIKSDPTYMSKKWKQDREHKKLRAVIMNVQAH